MFKEVMYAIVVSVIFLSLFTSFTNSVVDSKNELEKTVHNIVIRSVVKKGSAIDTTTQLINTNNLTSTLNNSQSNIISNVTNVNITKTTTTQNAAILPVNGPKNVDMNSLQTIFLIIAALGLGLISFIIYRSYKLRSSRAERRYGVQGDRTTQELIPLPLALEEDSDNEDQTLFDVNQGGSGGRTVGGTNAKSAFEL